VLLLVLISVIKYLIYVMIDQGDTAQKKCQRFLPPVSMSTTDLQRMFGVV